MSKSIMFIHGMFMNPKSWDDWKTFFEDEGYECVVPAWPFHEGEPANLRKRVPDGLGELPLQAVVDRMQETAETLEDPVLIGHSMGGLIVQLLVNRGIGSLGVPICSVAPNRMLAYDWGFLRNSASITNPLKGNEPFPMDADGFYKNFGNTMSRAASDAAYEQYATHESRNVLRDVMTDVAKVDLETQHVPFLFISADKDEIIPPELCLKNAMSYKHEGSRADHMEFKNRGHFICGQPGWEEVAAYIANWIPGKSSASVGASSIQQMEKQ